MLLPSSPAAAPWSISPRRWSSTRSLTTLDLANTQPFSFNKRSTFKHSSVLRIPTWRSSELRRSALGAKCSSLFKKWTRTERKSFRASWRTDRAAAVWTFSQPLVGGRVYPPSSLGINLPRLLCIYIKTRALKKGLFRFKSWVILPRKYSRASRILSLKIRKKYDFSKDLKYCCTAFSNIWIMNIHARLDTVQ